MLEKVWAAENSITFISLAGRKIYKSNSSMDTL